MTDISELIERLRRASEAWHDEAHALYGEAAAALEQMAREIERCFPPEAMEAMDRENTRLCEQVADLEAECGEAKDQLNKANSLVEYYKAERDAIKAKTIEETRAECAEICDAWTYAEEAASDIRALIQPAGEGGE